MRPNGQYDGSADSQPYETPRADYETGPMPDDFRQMSSQSMMGGQPKAGMYAAPGPYADGHNVYQNVSYPAPQPGQHSMHYTTIPPVGVLDQSYAPASVFPTPPMQHHHHPPHSESSPESYTTQDHYQNSDLADLLGSLKMDEKGTGKSIVRRGIVILLTTTNSSIS